MIDFFICYISLNRKVIGANEVDIYNFLTLVTIDTNINQFIKVYHILDKMQYKITKIFKVMKKTILWG